jgi:hypothetical protein
MRGSWAAMLVALAVAGRAGADCPGSSRLEEALTIIAEANPVLIAERGIYAEQTRQHPWETVVTVGYSVTDTFESGEAGPNAALRVRIPLWGRSNDLKTAQARATWKRAEDSVRIAFLTDIQALCEQAAQVEALDTLRAFHRDRLTYRQEQVDQGLAEPDTLWVETEAAQKAEHEWRREAGKLQAQRLTLARRYGGEDWGRLRALLEAMAQ